MTDHTIEQIPSSQDFTPESIITAQEYMDNIVTPVDNYVDRLWEVLRLANDFVPQVNQLTREDIYALVAAIQVIGPDQEQAVLNWQISEVANILANDPTRKLIVLHGGGRSGAAIEAELRAKFTNEIQEKRLIIGGKFDPQKEKELSTLPKDGEYAICALEDKAYSGVQIHGLKYHAFSSLVRAGFNITKTYLRLGGISTRSRQRLDGMFDDAKNLYYMPNGREVDNKLAQEQGEPIDPLSKIRNCVAIALEQIQQTMQLDSKQYQIFERGIQTLIDRIFTSELTIQYQRIPDEMSFPEIFSTRNGLWWPKADGTDYEKLYLLDFYKNRTDNK
jgi:hypothetical protein